MKDTEIFTGDILKSILNGMDALITVCSHKTFELLFLNDAIRRRFNVQSPYVGKKCYKVLQKLDAPCTNCPYDRITLDKSLAWEHIDVYGSVLYKNAKLIPWIGNKMAHLEYAIDISDTRRNEQENAELKDRIYHDALTGIRNRRYFEETIDGILRCANRGDDLIGMMMIDIDFFKRYNDDYGHAAGDECLTRIAQTIASCLTRRTDFVARFGGEEFVVVLPRITKSGLEFVADKILEAVSSIDTFNRTVTVSIGAAVGQGNDKAGLLEVADRALYDSKDNGRNRVTFRRDI